ncbi:hypothetical protein GCM10010377_05520 [Streptomyces viridiviolaceus]|nr:hypothetical protein GCM10010377_05520 [Streptomyces viridiviolaceus]
MPGACRAFLPPCRPADPRASVIVTLFSAPRGGPFPLPLRRTPVPMPAPPGAAPSRLTRRAVRLSGEFLMREFLSVSARRLPGADRLYSMWPIPYAS